MADFTCYTTVPGTGGWNPHTENADEWWQPKGAFATMFRKLGLKPLKDDPFVWSTDLNGHAGWRRWLKWLPFINSAGDTTDWFAGAKALSWYLGWTRYKKRTLLAHSHGGYVALIACANGLKVPVLVTVGTPVRHDMDDIIRKALPNIGAWIHFYDDHDWIQLGGGLTDGHVGVKRRFEFPGVLNVAHRAGHSGLLNNEDCYSLWHQQGWAALITTLANAPYTSPS